MKKYTSPSVEEIKLTSIDAVTAGEGGSVSGEGGAVSGGR